MCKRDGNAKFGARNQAVDSLREGPRRTHGDPSRLGGAPGLSMPPVVRDGVSGLELGACVIKSAALNKPMTSRRASAAAVRARSSIAMLIRPVTTGGRADSTGSEDNEGRVLPRVKAVTVPTEFRTTARFKVDIINALTVIAATGNL